MTSETKSKGGIILTEKVPADEHDEDQQGEAQQPARKQDHPNRSCADCDFSFFPINSASGERQNGGHCRIKPPTVHAIFVPPSIQGNPPQQHAVSNWPIVFVNQSCGEFVRKPGSTQ